jgi:hypothetical protein
VKTSRRRSKSAAIIGAKNAMIGMRTICWLKCADQPTHRDSAEHQRHDADCQIYSVEANHIRVGFEDLLQTGPQAFLEALLLKFLSMRKIRSPYSLLRYKPYHLLYLFFHTLFFRYSESMCSFGLRRRGKPYPYLLSCSETSKPLSLKQQLLPAVLCIVSLPLILSSTAFFCSSYLSADAFLSELWKLQQIYSQAGAANRLKGLSNEIYVPLIKVFFNKIKPLILNPRDRDLI